MSTEKNEVIDPVCGMTIDPAAAAGTSELAGITYFFCAKSCKVAFDADPSKYAAPAPTGHACCSTR